MQRNIITPEFIRPLIFKYSEELKELDYQNVQYEVYRIRYSCIRHINNVFYITFNAFVQYNDVEYLTEVQIPFTEFSTEDLMSIDFYAYAFLCIEKNALDDLYTDYIKLLYKDKNVSPGSKEYTIISEILLKERNFIRNFGNSECREIQNDFRKYRSKINA